MIASPGDVARAVATAELRAALLPSLRGRFGAARDIAALARRPSAYRTSHTLEELDIALDDGTALRLLFKDLGWRSLDEVARRAKPAFLRDPRRELAVYRRLLAPHDLGTARCYGAVADRRAGRHWLFLERVPGKELYQIGEFAVWQQVARWLARAHARFAARPGLARRARAAHLIRHDGRFYRRWMRRALAFARQGGVAATRAGAGRRTVEWLAARHDRVVARLVELPATIIHGEFFASNVLVQGTPGGPRVCPIDWETAALGPGLLDLAALVSGGWTEGEKRALALAYRAALPDHHRGEAPDRFLDALNHCRFQLAVQWLGWAPGWSPPSAHRQDWLGEAVQLAERLGL